MEDTKTDFKTRSVGDQKSDHYEFASRIIDSWSSWKQELACGKTVDSESKIVVDCTDIKP